ncbi:MAG TPA: hypothetical protein VET27_16395 [Mycobacterium sp.]|nr:hypothetical protein [Mycobacterium sp.]
MSTTAPGKHRRKGTLPHLGRDTLPPALVGDLLGGVTSGGGGWLVIGRRAYPIPPRPIAVADIARAAAPNLGVPIEIPELGEQLGNKRQAYQPFGRAERLLRSTG